MTSERPRLYFDFIDPLSWSMARELFSIDAVREDGVDWIPLELRPPPTPLTTLDDPELAERWSRVGESDPSGRGWAPPVLVPWTRKAHELVRHATESERASEVRRALFEAYLFDGWDIGRVDVLVELARTLGLDPGETKPVLDVDRHEAEIAELRASALAAGVTESPTLALGARLLEGFHNAAAIRTFLGT